MRRFFSKIKDTPNDSFATRAREGFFVGVSTERSKTILVLRSHDEVVELEPVTSYVEMSGDDPEPQEEEKKLDVHEDPISNVLRDNDQQQQDEFFDYNEGDESDDFDVNTVPMTFHPVVKDAGATIVSAKDVEKSSRALREEWRLAIHHAMQSLKEHDVYQEVAEEERWTVPSENIIPGKNVFSIKREGTKKVRIVGCGSFQEDKRLAVFTVNLNVITVSVVMLISSLLGWYVT